MPRPTRGRKKSYPYGAITHYGPTFQTVPVRLSCATGLVRVRSPLLTESLLMSFPPATEMVQFAGFASYSYVFTIRYRQSGGLPHSEILGSSACSRLPEAYRSVLRPSSPLNAKASTERPYLLDPTHAVWITQKRLFRMCSHSRHGLHLASNGWKFEVLLNNQTVERLLKSSDH